MNSISRVWDGELKAVRADGGRVTATRVQTSEVIHLDFSESYPVPSCARHLEDFLDEFEGDLAEHLPAARREVQQELAQTQAVRLSHLRLARGMSQKDLSDAIGCSQSMVSLIEGRRQKPGEDTIRALAEALQVDFNTLMGALENG